MIPLHCGLRFCGVLTLGAAAALAGESGPGGSERYAGSIPLRLAGPWAMRVGPGRAKFSGKPVIVKEAVTLAVPPIRPVQVNGEKHGRLPVFNLRAGGWGRGAKLAALRTQECSATGLLDPASVRVRARSGPGGAVFRRGVDYQLDDFWATLGRLEGGGIGPATPVWIDYRYTPCRLDAVFLLPNGHVMLAPGRPGVGVLLPPAAPRGAIRLACIWIHGATEALAEENLYPVHFDALAPLAPPRPAPAERLLPRTLAKLRAGKRVTIVAWGDSVTNGGGVGAAVEKWYQNQFAARLHKRFPKADIRMITAAWPGGNSHGWLAAPPGGKYDFRRDVLDKKPDLVTVEFVNDSGLNEQQTLQWYSHLLELLRGAGAEVILITPHFVRPDWMGVHTLQFSHDPRPYVKALRKFAKLHSVALADASKLWGRLWLQGIPYTTLLANSINHPDARGHALFADALMALFPAH